VSRTRAEDGENEEIHFKNVQQPVAPAGNHFNAQRSEADWESRSSTSFSARDRVEPVLTGIWGDCEDERDDEDDFGRWFPSLQHPPVCCMYVYGSYV